jgi:mannose-6-phosphate isomerase
MLTLKPRLDERIWGATTLPSFLEQPQPGRPVGEAWLTDIRCEIDGQSGMTLGDIVRRWPAAFGADEHGFRLLIKFLFPHDKLSVQVHPDDAGAREMGEARGKTECWYVLSAEPGAFVWLGLGEELPREEIERAIREGTLESRLRAVSVKAGDMVFVDAGTIHAIGPGVVILETQQYSDITYRLYDYGRARELHLERGLAAAKSGTHAGLIAPVERDGFTRLIESPYFVVDRLRLGAGERRSLGHSDELQILIPLADGASLLDGKESTKLPAGHAALLPATGRDWWLAGIGLSDAVAEVIRILQGSGATQ